MVPVLSKKPEPARFLILWLAHILSVSSCSPAAIFRPAGATHASWAYPLDLVRASILVCSHGNRVYVRPHRGSAAVLPGGLDRIPEGCTEYTAARTQTMAGTPSVAEAVPGGLHRGA